MRQNFKEVEDTIRLNFFHKRTHRVNVVGLLSWRKPGL
jgi:hypothetical protein